MRPHVKWLLPLLPLLLLALAHADRDPASIGNWRSASRAPAGLAPDPAATPQPVVQVYAAGAVRWRGQVNLFGVLGLLAGIEEGVELLSFATQFVPVA